MNDVREALKKKLDADPILSKLAKGGVWFENADQDAPSGTVIIFSQSTGHADWCFDGPPLRDQGWDVKGVGPSKVAGEVDDRCRELLTDADLEITNVETLFCQPMQDINYRELTGGETYQHVGATYSIMTERQG